MICLARSSGRLGQPQTADDVLADPPAAHQLDVRGHPLLAELRALVRRAGRVAALRRHVHRELGGVLGRPQEERGGGSAEAEQHGEQHDEPPLAQHAQVVLDRHGGHPTLPGPAGIRGIASVQSSHSRNSSY